MFYEHTQIRKLIKLATWVLAPLFDYIHIIYLDTDSITICLSTPTLDDVVLPSSREQWPLILKEWFVMNNKCPYEQRTPGLLKERVVIIKL